MGRYSVPLAPMFVAFAGVRSGMRVLDVGAGTGALTGELIRHGAEVAAAEPEEMFVEALRGRFPMADVKAAVAERLPWEDGSFDAALSQLAVSFMGDPVGGVREMRRTVQRGGTVALCMWDRNGMEMLDVLLRTREALGSVDVTTEPGMRYRTREELEGLFVDDLGQVTTELLSVASSYRGFDEFWDALCGGANESGRWAASLTGDAAREARAELLRQLGVPSGPFTLRAEAWAIRAAV